MVPALLGNQGLAFRKLGTLRANKISKWQYNKDIGAADFEAVMDINECRLLQGSISFGFHLARICRVAYDRTKVSKEFR